MGKGPIVKGEDKPMNAQETECADILAAVKCHLSFVECIDAESLARKNGRSDDDIKLWHSRRSFYGDEFNTRLFELKKLNVSTEALQLNLALWCKEIVAYPDPNLLARYSKALFNRDLNVAKECACTLLNIQSIRKYIRDWAQNNEVFL